MIGSDSVSDFPAVLGLIWLASTPAFLVGFLTTGLGHGIGRWTAFGLWIRGHAFGGVGGMALVWFLATLLARFISRPDLSSSEATNVVYWLVLLHLTCFGLLYGWLFSYTVRRGMQSSSLSDIALKGWVVRGTIPGLATMLLIVLFLWAIASGLGPS